MGSYMPFCDQNAHYTDFICIICIRYWSHIISTHAALYVGLGRLCSNFYLFFFSITPIFLKHANYCNIEKHGKAWVQGYGYLASTINFCSIQCTICNNLIFILEVPDGLTY